MGSPRKVTRFSMRRHAPRRSAGAKPLRSRLSAAFHWPHVSACGFRAFRARPLSHQRCRTPLNVRRTRMPQAAPRNPPSGTTSPTSPAPRPPEAPPPAPPRPRRPASAVGPAFFADPWGFSIPSAEVWTCRSRRALGPAVRPLENGLPISEGEVILELSTLLPDPTNRATLPVARIPCGLLRSPSEDSPRLVILSSVESFYFSAHPFKRRKENSVCPTFSTYYCTFATLFSKIPPVSYLFAVSVSPRLFPLEPTPYRLFPATL